MVTKTWNYKNLKINFNGAAITALNGDASITADAEEWSFIEGEDFVERSLVDNHLCTVTLPMMVTSPQIDIFAIAKIADKQTGAGPFPFSMVRTDGNYKLFGTATVMSIGKPVKSKVGQARNVTLKIVMQAEYEGA
ncbi:MAG: hypothetical protein J6U20_04220 [Fibrobacter sp.]|nr:hypothetical protein [Fibrobacter sp.]